MSQIKINKISGKDLSSEDLQNSQLQQRCSPESILTFRTFTFHTVERKKSISLLQHKFLTRAPV